MKASRLFEIAALASTILMKSSVASLIACQDNTYNTKRMTQFILLSSKSKSTTEIRWCFYSPIPYTYGLLCCVCIVLWERYFIYIMYILMNWEGALHEGGPKETDGIGESQCLSDPPRARIWVHWNVCTPTRRWDGSMCVYWYSRLFMNFTVYH